MTVSQLQWQIRRLKQLPNDFRDTLEDGTDWDDFAELTGKRTEMETWLHGPVLFVVPLNEKEKIFFRSSRKLMSLSESYVCSEVEPAFVPSFEELLMFVLHAETAGYSFFYLPMFPYGVSKALNTMLSATGANLRIRAQLLDTRGYPLGVVH